MLREGGASSNLDGFGLRRNAKAFGITGSSAFADDDTSLSSLPLYSTKSIMYFAVYGAEEQA
jgi:hypothetical protein